MRVAKKDDISGRVVKTVKEAKKKRSDPDRMGELISLLKEMKSTLAKEYPTPQVTVRAPDMKMPEVIIPGPPKKWTFSVKRNSDGFIESITAERFD